MIHNSTAFSDDFSFARLKNRRTYPGYKASAIEWIGDIPEHWECRRLKYLGKAIIGLTYSPADVTDKENGTLVLRASNIQDGKILLDDNVYVDISIPQKLRTRETDILICSRNGSQHLVGKSGKISSNEAGLSFGAFTTVFRSKLNHYLFWLFNSGLMTQRAGMYHTSTIFQLTTGILNEFRVAIPPISEQKTIAAFLDRQTATIDELTAKKNTLLSLLHLKRSATISRFVTRGPAATARTRQTGFDWLPEIPAHWLVRKFRYSARIVNGQIDPEASEFRDLPLIAPNHIVSRTGKLLPLETAADQAAESGKYLFRAGVVLYSKIRPELVKVCIAPCDGLCSADMYAITPRDDLLPEYLMFFMLTREFTTNVVLSTLRVAMPKVNRRELGGFPVLVPPLDEQRAIVNRIHDEIGRIDNLVLALENQKRKLSEYRSALITAAVTGKFDVRLKAGEAAPE